MNKVITILFLSLSLNCMALEKRNYSEVSINDITVDTQAQPEGSPDNHMTLVWWVPFEYWASVFSRDPNVTDVVRDQMLNVLKDYTVLAIVQSDISPMGSFNFYSKERVLKGLSVKFKNSSSNMFQLLPSENVSSDMGLLMSQMTPVLQAAMGNMGSNFHFFIYDDSDKNGKRVVDPYKEGVLDVKVLGRDEQPLDVNFKMPLNSLFVPRICPNGEKAHVSWKYCPWSGKKI